MAELPDGDRILSFDAYRARLLALPESIAVASPARREELCRILVERVVVDGNARRGDRLDAAGPTLLREKTAGVPPRGLKHPPAV